MSVDVGGAALTNGWDHHAKAATLKTNGSVVEDKCDLFHGILIPVRAEA